MNVNGLLGFGVRVPSLETADEYYKTFGLEVLEGASSLRLRCEGMEQDKVTLLEGPRKRLSFVQFGVDPGEFREFQHRLEKKGARFENGPADAPQGGLWLRDPDGVPVNLREELPDEGRKPIVARFNMGDRQERWNEARWLDFGADYQPSPRRLGHIVMFVSDLEKAQNWYMGMLGLKLSDWMPGFMSFFHARPGDHHVFALIQSTHPGLHHSSWGVDTFDDIVKGADHMADGGYREGWGLGRHTLGSNLFHYSRDPWGSWTEYFADIDQINGSWKPRGWECPAAVWAPPDPETFVTNFEASDVPIC